MDKSKLEPRYTMLNIFAKFQRCRTILDKCGSQYSQLSPWGKKNVDDEGFLVGMAAVAVETAAVVAAAAMATMTAAAGSAAGMRRQQWWWQQWRWWPKEQRKWRRWESL